MKPSVVMLMTGETVVTNLQEVFKGEGEDKRGVCLMMAHPFKLDLVSKPTDEPSKEVQVQFTRWMPFSSEYQYKIPYDAVLTIGEPEESLRKAYEAKVEAAEKKIEEAKNPKPETKSIWASDVSVAGVAMG